MATKASPNSIPPLKVRSGPTVTGKAGGEVELGSNCARDTTAVATPAPVDLSPIVVTSRDTEGVSAACTLDREGLVTIRAVTEALNGASHITTCRLDVVSVRVADIVARAM